MSGEGDSWGVRSLLRPGAVLVLLVLLLVLAASWCRRYARFRRLELAMPGPRSLPVIGSVLKLVSINEDNVLEKVLDLWGGHYAELSRVSIFNTLIVFVTDPDHVAKVLRCRVFSEKSHFIYDHLEDVLGEGLVTSNGAQWKSRRILMQPAFNADILNDLVDVILEEADGLVDRLRPLAGKDVEYSPELYRCIAAALFKSKTFNFTEGYDDEFELMISTIPKVIKAISKRALRPWLWPSAVFYRTATGREQIKFRKLVCDVVGRILERAVICKQKGVSVNDTGHTLHVKERKSFTETLVEFMERSHSKKDAVDELTTIAGAAIETTSATLSFTLKILSIYPNIQSLLYEEICDVFERGNRLLCAGDLERLQYMDRVLKEALRLFPPLAFVCRNVSEETELGGKTVPADTIITINFFGMHRDPRHFPNPLEFDPDRFLPEKVADRHPHCFLPFSGGPRNCIGKQLAMMQMKTVLAILLRAYSVHPAHDGITHPSQIPITVGLTLAMVDNVKVRFEARSLNA